MVFCVVRTDEGGGGEVVEMGDYGGEGRKGGERGEEGGGRWEDMGGIVLVSGSGR